MASGRDTYLGLDDFSPPATTRSQFATSARVVGMSVAVGAALIGFLIFVIVASAAARAIDEQVHTNAFAPGYWASDDGSNWIRLDADGTGEMSIRVPSANPDRCASWEAPLTYEFTPGESAPYGTLAFDSPAGTTEDCSLSGLYVFADGWWGGGYNWDALCVPADDPDECSVRLARR